MADCVLVNFKTSSSVLLRIYVVCSQHSTCCSNACTMGATVVHSRQKMPVCSEYGLYLRSSITAQIASSILRLTSGRHSAIGKTVYSMNLKVFKIVE